jgi:hypothetical protein
MEGCDPGRSRRSLGVSTSLQVKKQNGKNCSGCEKYFDHLLDIWIRPDRGK